MEGRADPPEMGGRRPREAGACPTGEPRGVAETLRAGPAADDGTAADRTKGSPGVQAGTEAEAGAMLSESECRSGPENSVA